MNLKDLKDKWEIKDIKDRCLTDKIEINSHSNILKMFNNCVKIKSNSIGWK